MAVEIVDYDPAWPARFAVEEARIAGALGGVALRIEHVGSTSVPGLAGKDVIDIQVSVRALDDMAPYQAPLEQLGYVYRADDEPAHRFFKLEDAAGKRLAQIHVCAAGGAWEAEVLAFRDLLRSDATLRAAYAAHKRELAPRFDDRQAYAEAKAPFIVEALRRRRG